MIILVPQGYTTVNTLKCKHEVKIHFPHHLQCSVTVVSSHHPHSCCHVFQSLLCLIPSSSLLSCHPFYVSSPHHHCLVIPSVSHYIPLCWYEKHIFPFSWIVCDCRDYVTCEWACDVWKGCHWSRSGCCRGIRLQKCQAYHWRCHSWSVETDGASVSPSGMKRIVLHALLSICETHKVVSMTEINLGVEMSFARCVK